MGKMNRQSEGRGWVRAVRYVWNVYGRGVVDVQIRLGVDCRELLETGNIEIGMMLGLRMVARRCGR